MNEGKWITINGKHIFLKEGQSPMDAFIRSKGKSKNDTSINKIDNTKLMKINPNSEIYRAYNEEFKSKGFDKTGYFYDDDKELVLETYGDNIDIKTFDKNSKIYEYEKSSWDYVHKNNLLNNKYDFLKDLTSQYYPISNDKKLDTLDSLFKDIEQKGYGYYDDELNIYNYTDMGLYATQMVAKYELEKQGYDGVHWINEEQDDPRQYQIWNEKVLKRK